MNLILTTSQFYKKNVYFSEPIENTIIENSQFIKLTYSNKDITLNGIYILLDLNITSKEHYFKKIKYNFDINQNNECLKNFLNIEKQILCLYNLNNKTCKYSINELLKNSCIKIYPSDDKTNNSNKFMVKISGIWENSKELGLTYKIINI
jgi:hypothetical protein